MKFLPKVIIDDVELGPLLKVVVNFDSNVEADRIRRIIADCPNNDNVTLKWTNAEITMKAVEWKTIANFN